MSIRLSGADGVARILVAGRFTFETHPLFHRACDQALALSSAGRITVDLREVTYLDSSALGMLLGLREKAQAAGTAVSLAVASGTARDILAMANFEKLFDFT